MAPITLTTDFGTVDGYAGAMKGVILSIAPEAVIVDISHNVVPHDVRHCARVLATAAPHFPIGSIHIAVVDPGVGSSRRGIAVQTPEAIFIGPDNGVFTPFLESRLACYGLTHAATYRHPTSRTFHGRDVFAPVAANLYNGLPLAELGPPVDDPTGFATSELLPLPNGQFLAEVVYVDHFGNLITNLGREILAHLDLDRVRLCVGDVALTIRSTYSDVEPGALLALIGSDGYAEIAVREGSAAESLSLGIGAIVEVRRQ